MVVTDTPFTDAEEETEEVGRGALLLFIKAGAEAEEGENGNEDDN